MEQMPQVTTGAKLVRPENPFRRREVNLHHSLWLEKLWIEIKYLVFLCDIYFAG